ncbi:hypothetical protein OHAE_2845 [Ochrobactrum soli]|uniref:Uncharacterized protein n=1 Tax=Ochrobactrum soli TaxID=2448455 RepID=A0A2P9HFN2_9HYPH|nr:hypothetical protein OHAE_2845 [[Ochrobactrum] soli]
MGPPRKISWRVWLEEHPEIIGKQAADDVSRIYGPAHLDPTDSRRM